MDRILERFSLKRSSNRACMPDYTALYCETMIFNVNKSLRRRLLVMGFRDINKGLGAAQNRVRLQLSFHTRTTTYINSILFLSNPINWSFSVRNISWYTIAYHAIVDCKAPQSNSHGRATSTANMSSSQPFHASSPMLEGEHRRKKSRFTYRQLAQLAIFSTSCPLRVVAHVDLDAFYAQCEMIRNNVPEDQPLAVQQWWF
jgi:hypothetical protein